MQSFISTQSEVTYHAEKYCKYEKVASLTTIFKAEVVDKI